MFKIAADQTVKAFASDNEHWDPNSTMMDSSKIQLLSVAVETPSPGFIRRLLRQSSTFVHDSTFKEITKVPTDTEAKDITPDEPVVIGEFDTKRELNLDGSIKVEMAKLFSVSAEGVLSVTAINQFGKLHKQVYREQQLVEYFKTHMVDTTNPLIKQLTRRTGVTVYIVSGIAFIKGDSKLTYELTTNGKVVGSHDGTTTDVNGRLGGNVTHTKDLSVPNGTVMMYKLTKVKIDKNTGRVTPVFSQDRVSCWQLAKCC